MSQVKQASVISNYIPSLDGLRAIAVLVVALGHFGATLKIPEMMLDHHPFYQFLRSTGTGVDLFFVMSGFLITSILLEVRARDGSMKSFWMRRIIRIAPLYIFYLIFLILLPLVVDVEFLKLSSFGFLEWVGIFVYFANIVFLFHGRVSQEYVILWSLSIEEQFYLIWPFLVKSLELKELRRFILMAIGLAILLRFGSQLYGPEVDAHYFVLFCRMDSLLLGGLIAYLRTYGEFEKTRKWIAKWGWPFAAAVLLFLLQKKSYHHEVKDAFYIGYYYFLLAFSWGVIVLHAIEATAWTERVLANRLIRYIGKISYGLYMWHPIVGKIANHHMDTFGIHPESYAIRIIVMLLLSTVAASVSYHTIEKVFLKLKKYFPYFTGSANTLSEKKED